MSSTKVIFGLRCGEVSGVDVFSVRLAQGLIKAGLSSRILLTQSASEFQLPLTDQVPVDHLDVKPADSWPTRWQKMIRYLEGEAPCVYIPNYDYAYSCVSPRLSKRVMILGIVHSDDPVHYEHVSRLGAYWNSIVAVSEIIAKKTIAACPSLSARVRVIPYGVPVPKTLSRRSSSAERPLKLIYVGRLIEYQKRILELPKIFHVLTQRRIPFHATIVGDGPQRTALLGACAQWMEQGVVSWQGVVPNNEVLKLLDEHDVIFLTSEFEGLPISVLEGMAQGCIPVCLKTESGLPDLVQEGENGYLVEPGDYSTFADRLASLQSQPVLRERFSLSAYNKVQKFKIETMILSYLECIESMVREAYDGSYRRPPGKILLPPTMKVTWKDHIPARIRLAGKKGKRYLRRVFNVSMDKRASL